MADASSVGMHVHNGMSLLPTLEASATSLPTDAGSIGNGTAAS
ncbi:MAG TPA: hypothetical protein VL096_19680 [Pirellulaceae bacterium]|nr:hypothetical protein [Pirellulaceae bacterium]